MLPGATRPIGEGNPWDPVVTEAWPAAEKKDGTGELATASKLRLTNDHDWWRKAPRSKNVTFPPGCPALSNYSMSSMHTFYQGWETNILGFLRCTIQGCTIQELEWWADCGTEERDNSEASGFQVAAPHFLPGPGACTCSAPFVAPYTLHGTVVRTLTLQELAVAAGSWVGQRPSLSHLIEGTLRLWPICT